MMFPAVRSVLTKSIFVIKADSYSRHFPNLISEFNAFFLTAATEVAKVCQALSNVRRKPGESLNEVVLKVQALTYMLYTMLSPNKEDSLIQKRASNTALDALLSLMSPPAVEKYKVVRLKKITRLDIQCP